MTRRVRVLWLPAVAMTFVAEALLYLVTRSGYRPRTILLDWHVFHSHHSLGLLAATVGWPRHREAARGPIRR